MKGLPFVLGTDIVRISRLDPIRKPESFVKLVKRFLRTDEIPTSSTKSPRLLRSGAQRELSDWLLHVQRPPVPSSSADDEPMKLFETQARNAARWLAGRWAAKEAAIKAWGAGLVSYKDVKVGLDLEAPYVFGGSRPVKVECRPLYSEVSEFLGRALDPASEEGALFRQNGRLSISHDGDYCVATVMAEPLNEDLMAILRHKKESVRRRQANGWQPIDEIVPTGDKAVESTQSPLRDGQVDEGKPFRHDAEVNDDSIYQEESSTGKSVSDRKGSLVG